jgi:glycosyltransferase involved in cell wall biosynthesis
MSNQPDGATKPSSGAGTVSVILPAFNSAGFLAEAIESIYKRTVAPHEVIVVNDGSTDGTESLLRRLSAGLPPTFRWITQENRGSASARNLGIRLATGNFIAFLDHDDVWLPQKLARHVEQFEAQPELTLSFTAMRVAPYERTDDGSLRPLPIELQPSALSGAARADDGTVLGTAYLQRDWSSAPEGVLGTLMSQSPIGSLSTVMVRREAFDRVGGFSEDLRVADDWLMWLKMAAAGMRFGHIPEALVEYRWHLRNLSGSHLMRMNDMTAVFDEFLASNDLPRRIRKEVRLRRWCAHWHLITAIEEARAGNGARARRHLYRAARAHPRSIRPGWIRLWAMRTFADGPS